MGRDHNIGLAILLVAALCSAFYLGSSYGYALREQRVNAAWLVSWPIGSSGLPKLSQQEVRDWAVELIASGTSQNDPPSDPDAIEVDRAFREAAAAKPDPSLLMTASKSGDAAIALDKVQREHERLIVQANAQLDKLLLRWGLSRRELQSEVTARQTALKKAAEAREALEKEATEVRWAAQDLSLRLKVLADLPNNEFALNNAGDAYNKARLTALSNFSSQAGMLKELFPRAYDAIKAVDKVELYRLAKELEAIK